MRLSETLIKSFFAGQSDQHVSFEARVETEPFSGVQVRARMAARGGSMNLNEIYSWDDIELFTRNWVVWQQEKKRIIGLLNKGVADRETQPQKSA
jgi:hypothetical protein